MGDEHSPKLSYFISEKNSIAVVCFIGQLARDGLNVLEACTSELESRSFEVAILSFRDVAADCERPTFRALTQLQKLIRDRGAQLRVSGLHPKLRAELLSLGVVREDELCNNLVDALKGIAHQKAE